MTSSWTAFRPWGCGCAIRPRSQVRARAHRFVVFVALEQIGVGTQLLTTFFGAVMLALALGCGLAFGLGGQDTARRWLSRGESTVSNAASQVTTQQSTNPYSATAQAMEQQSMNPESEEVLPPTETTRTQRRPR